MGDRLVADWSLVRFYVQGRKYSSDKMFNLEKSMAVA